jgi:predicted acylesterase/phospholipase RssA
MTCPPPPPRPPTPTPFGRSRYYSPGALYVLTKCRGLRIRRIAGASAGAWCAAFYHSGLTLAEWVDSYRETQSHVSEGLSLLEACVHPHLPTPFAV